MVVVYIGSGLTNLITDGARETHKTETVAVVATTATLTDIPADGANAKPLLVVHGIAAGVSLVLKYATSGPASGEFTISGAVVTTAAGDGFTEVVAHYRIDNA